MGHFKQAGHTKTNEKQEPSWWMEGGGATGTLALQKQRGQNGSKWEAMRLDGASAKSQQTRHASVSHWDLIL